MRRPAPLPVPVGTTRTEEIPDRAAAAPVLPLPESVTAAAPQPEALEPAAAATEDRIGARDVWRAARARRRVLRAEVRRFTVRARHRRAIWLSIAGALVLLVAGTFGIAYTPVFAVQTIRVVGTHELDAAKVEQSLKGILGTPLPLVDASAVKAALGEFPFVESYSLEARPPGELVVRIVERTPVGVVKSGSGYTLVDAAGVDLGTTAAVPPGQPLITASGGTGSETFRAVGQVIRSLPTQIRAQLSAAAASTPDDVTLTLAPTGTTVIWGSADDSARKALVLQKIMAAKPPGTVSSYDVSSPDAVLVR